MENSNQNTNSTLVEQLEEARVNREKEHKQRMYKYELTREIRKKYSIDDEIAILRQRDTKPKEYMEWCKFVENTKKILKNKFMHVQKKTKRPSKK